MARVFTYGSLMFDPVWREVVGRERASCSAHVSGYKRWRITGDAYPALVPAAGRSGLAGRLYLGVSRRDLERLNAYEGGLYRRVLVRVQTASHSCSRPAFVYLLAPSFRHRLHFCDWEPSVYAQNVIG